MVIVVAAAAGMLLYTGFQKMEWNCKKFSLNISVHNFDTSHTSSQLCTKFCNIYKVR